MTAPMDQSSFLAALRQGSAPNVNPPAPAPQTYTAPDGTQYVAQNGAWVPMPPMPPPPMPEPPPRDMAAVAAAVAAVPTVEPKRGPGRPPKAPLSAAPAGDSDTTLLLARIAVALEDIATSCRVATQRSDS